RLLAGAEMRRPVHVPLEEERLDAVLESADQRHPPVEAEVELGALRGDGGLDVAHVAVDSSSARSAPRTYVFPVTSSSSAGKRVSTSGPVGVTTTSSSIRAAERPSVAGQY